MYAASILKDSVAPSGARLTTFELTYPRIVHAELMTHRVFSRNSASSRAIPVSKMLERIEADPAMPVFWGANQTGMQAALELEEEAKQKAMRVWLSARDSAVAHVRQMVELGVHKQIANRITEPWMFITVIVSATTYTNWFRLRSDKDAQPEIRHLSDLMLALYQDSKPQELPAGGWHLPLWGESQQDYVHGLNSPELYEEAGLPPSNWYGTVDAWIAALISAGRVARTSYLTHHGTRDLVADVRLATRLVLSRHMSPLEHVAVAVNRDQWNGQMRLRIEEQLKSDQHHNLITPCELGNFTGWKQLRKFVANESGFSA